MLVLTRKIGERICVGENCWILVVDVRHGRVKLGLDAPREVEIMRGEKLENSNGRPCEVRPGRTGQSDTTGDLR